jgi:hypothetical protein
MAAMAPTGMIDERMVTWMTGVVTGVVTSLV